MAIGERIINARKKAGLTQVELAEKAGTSKQNINKYEHGVITNIPSNKIEAIANACGVSPEYLMGWTDEERENKLHDYFMKLSESDKDEVLAYVEFKYRNAKKEASRLLKVVKANESLSK